jgi:TfoX/Sxy family transcriptional regulator of competence genes
MAYDQHLAERVRAVLIGTDAVTERKMFGGLGFLVGGHMACGIVGNELMLRLGNEGADAALDEPHSRPMDFTGKPLRSMVYVAHEGFASDADLRVWVLRGVGFAKTFPPKS